MEWMMVTSGVEAEVSLLLGLANGPASGAQATFPGLNAISAPRSTPTSSVDGASRALELRPEISVCEASNEKVPSIPKKRMPRIQPCRGCQTQRKKCDTAKPACLRCVETGVDCVYETSRKPYARRMLPNASPFVTQQSQSAGIFSRCDSHLAVTASLQHTHPPPPTSSTSSVSSFLSSMEGSVSLLSESTTPLGILVPPQSFRFGPQHHHLPASPSSNSSPPQLARIVQIIGDVVDVSSLPEEQVAAVTGRRPVPCSCCRERKLKCDRLRPFCTNCEARRLRCEYLLPPKKMTMVVQSMVNSAVLSQTVCDNELSEVSDKNERLTAKHVEGVVSIAALLN
ncbi:hypothetical protein BC830DRAFT_656691 [Chytriomyces sp. MP71]|nr:hypothetical protein BC830DRAFT_656691 [Chytriomyces sp. MP71]